MAIFSCGEKKGISSFYIHRRTSKVENNSDWQEVVDCHDLIRLDSSLTNLLDLVLKIPWRDSYVETN